MTKKGGLAVANAVTNNLPEPAEKQLNIDPELGIDLAGLAREQLVTKKIERVLLSPLAALKILKHTNDSFPLTVNGQLMGVDEGETLQVTNSFACLSSSSSAYELEMLRNLRKLNYDASVVGWYQSCELGSFWNTSLLESQFRYQKMKPNSVVIMYDPAKSTLGELSIKAFRLSSTVMEMFDNDVKFTMDSIKTHALSTILEEIPIKIKNSHLFNAFMCDLEKQENLDNQHLGGIRYLEKNLDYLSDVVEEHGQEQWRWNGWYRNVTKEQQRLMYSINKKKAENANKVAQGLEPVWKEDSLSLDSNVQYSKLVAGEPSRLETLVISNQIDTYCQQISDYAGAGLKEHGM